VTLHIAPKLGKIPLSKPRLAQTQALYSERLDLTEEQTAALLRAAEGQTSAFATLYYDTFGEMWGPRLTSDTTGNVGGLQVQPGDMLTFDSSQRLVKVSEW